MSQTLASAPLGRTGRAAEGSAQAMTTIVFELFEALKKAGIDEETARKVAQAVLAVLAAVGTVAALVKLL